MNNGQTNERALLANCKGVFAATSYINVGTAEKPLLYANDNPRKKDRSSFKGKQFVTNPQKPGRLPEVYFDKKYPFISDGDKYVDRTRYLETQKEPKRKGFGTGDFRRRDEFSNIIRTEQYRQQLGSENKMLKFQLRNMTQADVLGMDEETAEELLLSTFGPGEPEKILYDLVYDKDLGESTSKLHRDSKNPTAQNYDRNFGTRKTSNMKYGYKLELNPHSKPDNARIPYIRTTFYRPAKVPLKSYDANNP